MSMPAKDMVWVFLIVVIWCQQVGECRGWSWIVASAPGMDASTVASSPPRCPSYCLNALGGYLNPNITVGLWWCEGTTFPNERWSFNATSSTISIFDDGDTPISSRMCLDTNLVNGSNILLIFNCSDSSPTQRWSFEADTHRLKSLAGLGNASYVSTSYKPTTNCNYLVMTDNATLAQMFIMVDQSVMNFYYAPPLPASSQSNLILNGDLQVLTSFAPLPVPLVDIGLGQLAQKLSYGDYFVLCNWALGNGDLTLGGCGMHTCSIPMDWCSSKINASGIVFLNKQDRPTPARPGGITQAVATYPGSSYLLLFDMRNPFKKTQSVRVLVTEASPYTQQFYIPFDQAEAVTHQFRFTATGPFVNVTFTSEDSTDCGPSINNIQLYLWPAEDHESTSSWIVKASTLGAISGLVLAVVICAVIGGLCLASSPWHRKEANSTPLENRITVYSFKQLKAYTQDFRTRIGEGRFCNVYLGELPESGQAIAVKRLKDVEDTSLFKAEVRLLSSVHQRYIVKFLGYCDDKGERMLVFEYMPNKSLYNRLHVEKIPAPLSWDTRMQIAYQVAYALEYLHHGASPAVLHRDVKSANVLLTETLTAKLADLGISKVGCAKDPTHWTSTMTAVKGSYGYLDPYYLQTGRASPKSDVYSFGVLLLELVTGRKVLMSDLETLTKWVQRIYWDQQYIDGGETSLAGGQSLNAEKETSIVDGCLCGCVSGSSVDAVMQIARCCLHQDPRQRPSMVEVVRGLRDLLAASQQADDTEDLATADQTTAFF